MFLFPTRRPPDRAVRRFGSPGRARTFSGSPRINEPRSPRSGWLLRPMVVTVLAAALTTLPASRTLASAFGPFSQFTPTQDTPTPQIPTVALLSSGGFVQPEGTVTAKFSISAVQPTDTIEWELRARLDARRDDGSSSLAASVLASSVLGVDEVIAGFDDPVSTTSAIPASLLNNGELAIQMPLTAETAPATQQAGAATSITRSGIYPLVVRVIRDGSTVAQSYVFVTRLPTAASGLTVGLITREPTALSTLPSGEVEFTADTLERLSQIVTQLEEDTKKVITPVLRGETVDALFRAADDSINRLAERIKAAMQGRGVLRAPYSFLHLGAWAAATENPDLQISLAASSSTVKSAFGSLPVATVSPPDPSLSSGAAEVLASLGTSTVLLDAAGVPLAQPLSTRTGAKLTVADGKELPAFWVDDALSARLTDTADVQGINRFVTTLAATALDFGDVVDQPGVAVLAIPPQTTPGALSSIIAQVGDAQPLLTLEPLATWGERPPIEPTTSIKIPDTPVSTLGDLPIETNHARQLLNAYRNTVGDADPSALVDNQLLLLATTLGITKGEQLAYIEDVRRRTRQQLDTIRFEEPGTVTLTSREIELPLQFSNGTPYDATVEVSFGSGRVEVIDATDGKREFVVPPGQSTLRVPVRLRSSGQFVVPLRVETADSNELVQSAQITIRSAAFSGLGVVLSLVSLAVLAGWWIQTHRKRSRNRKLTDSGEPATDVR